MPFDMQAMERAMAARIAENMRDVLAGNPVDGCCVACGRADGMGGACLDRRGRCTDCEHRPVGSVEALISAAESAVHYVLAEQAGEMQP